MQRNHGDTLRKYTFKYMLINMYFYNAEHTYVFLKW